MKRRLRLSLGAWRCLTNALDGGRGELKWHTDLAYSLSGIVHSSLLRLQTASHAEALNGIILSPPIFLLGFWRSGTTLLHELLCCDPQFGFPSTYACLNPSHFLLTEAKFSTRNAPETKRPMDAMPYSWASPQEDEFALLALGASSPYQALIMPSLLRAPRTLVDIRQHSVHNQQHWVATLKSFLKLVTVQQRRPLVLKSPPHGYRLPLLMSEFPEAHYIIIERNPYEVFASNLKLWRTLLELYAVEPWTPEEIENFVLEAYVVHEEAISQGSRKASSHQLARVRYEDIVADPVREMERIYGELNLSNFDAVRAAVEKYKEKVSSHRRNHFVMSPAQKIRVEQCWGSFISAKGYKWTEQYLRVES
jgi:omega-hydroxy-beta-dihydromenaquinone-9 sulfotransferase